MPKTKPDQNILRISEIFRSFLFTIPVPDDINPENMINLFDHPEMLCVIIDFEVPIICLKEYRHDVIHDLRELHSDILEPINGPESKARILN